MPGTLRQVCCVTLPFLSMIQAVPVAVREKVLEKKKFVRYLTSPYDYLVAVLADTCVLFCSLPVRLLS